MFRARRLILLGLVVVTPACEVVRTPYRAPQTVGGSQRYSAEEIARSVESVLDRSVDPCVDFYQFACGTWLKSTPIHPDRSRVGRAFTDIEERNHLVLRDLLEQAVRSPGVDPDQGKLGRFYESCMDAEAIERMETNPLQPILTMIEAVQDLPSLMRVAGNLRQIG